MEKAKIPFRPVRCLESALETMTAVDGHVIFTTDTRKIFMANNGEFKMMGGSSGVFYGTKVLTDDEKYGDQVILTNDNPRNEDPESIIRDIQKGCNGKEIVIFNRVEAIKKAMNSYQNGDIIVLVGRGAEKIQKTKTAGLSLSDREIVLSILNGEDF